MLGTNDATAHYLQETRTDQVASAKIERIHNTSTERNRLEKLQERGFDCVAIAVKMGWSAKTTKRRLRFHGLLPGSREPKYCQLCKQVITGQIIDVGDGRCTPKCHVCGQCILSKYYDAAAKKETRPKWANWHRSEYDYDEDGPVGPSKRKGK